MRPSPTRCGSAETNPTLSKASRALLATSAFLALLTAPVLAEITRIDVESTVVVANNADPGNAVGAYELITGRAYGAVDPSDPLNQIITDIEHAPRNADGLVEYDTKLSG
jgi:hypothetical protein